MDKSCEEKAAKGPFVVVSDVHLGGAGSKYKEFREFLAWLSKLDGDGTPLNFRGFTLNIRKPGTFVLLGDILELWDPRKDDRNYVVQDFLTPVSILSNLDSDIIYVLGNHDEKLRDLKQIWDEEGISFPYGGSGKFRIMYRTYPERKKGSKTVEGIKIGINRYAFLHGHQFDSLQIFYRLSCTVGARFDPVDWFQDLANLSFTKNIKFRLNKSTVAFAILFLIYTASYLRIKDTPIGSRLGVGWVIVSGFFVLIIFPRLITSSYGVFWPCMKRILSISKKGKSVEDVVRARYLKIKGQFIKADTIVFGHTHIPGSYYMKGEDKLFINTGCWVEECEETKRNTFLYIDDEGAFLLKWDQNGVQCLEKHRRIDKLDSQSRKCYKC